MPFRDFVTASLPDTDADEILDQLAFEDDSDDEGLPAGELDGDSADDEDDDEPMDTAEEIDQAFLSFTEPDGFTVVERPSVLLSGASLKGLFVVMLWTTGWHVGRVKRFAPRRQRHNYDITWADGTRGSKLDLDEYYVCPQVGEKFPLGAWSYLYETVNRRSLGSHAE